jgi:hypothetical protein
MLGVLQDFALGSAEKDAALTRYAQLYARDSFNIFNRNYSQIIANDLDVQYFEYFGQVIKDTRPFCMERVGKTFSKAEIESWASLSWQGKNPNTDKSTVFYLLWWLQLYTFINPTSIQSRQGERIKHIQRPANERQKIVYL